MTVSAPPSGWTPVKRIPLALPALLPVLLLAACGGGEPAATGTTPPVGAPPASPSPSRAAPAPGTAADGRDLNACRDGDCEVVVKAGDVLRFNDKVGTDPLTVMTAGETFSVTDPSGFAASVGGAGTLQTGSVRIEVGEAEGRRTAVRISPRG